MGGLANKMIGVKLFFEVVHWSYLFTRLSDNRAVVLNLFELAAH
jgi:hypothetical protein